VLNRNRSHYILHPLDIGRDENNSFVVTPYVNFEIRINGNLCTGSTLEQYIGFHRGQDEFRPLNEGQVRHLTRQILNMLNTIHSEGFAHRDLWADNILVQIDENNEVHCFLIDFGFSVRCELIEGAQRPYTAQSYQRIPVYESTQKMQIMPPEVLDNAHPERGINPMLCDMWALGVILYFALTGAFPFAAARSLGRGE
jgi:serine/threonine protein kinase